MFRIVENGDDFNVIDIHNRVFVSCIREGKGYYLMNGVADRDRANTIEEAKEIAYNMAYKVYSTIDMEV